MTTLQVISSVGWYETNSEGQGTLYLALCEEGVTTGPSDTPANAQFIPRIKNADSFSIKRAPLVWVWGNTQVQQAAFANLDLDNYDGFYNNLMKFDLRDWTVILKLPTAGTLQSGTSIRDTPTIATAIIDDCYANEDDTITLVLKDTIARLDRQLPCRYNKPFADSGAANNIIPMTFGACRNIAPLLVDSPNRIFELHDAPISNLTLVSDMAAPLDPHAAPPQYTPALSNSGLQLQAMPVGKLTAECSSVGQQAIIPGADDILSGAGAFPDTWAGTNGAPTGFIFSNGAGSAISEDTEALFSPANGCRIGSTKILNPGSTYGESIVIDIATFPQYALLGGRSYRISFNLFNVQSQQPALTNGFYGGFVLATALTTNAQDYITGRDNPLNTGAFALEQSFIFEYTVPVGSPRPIYFILTPSSGSSPSTASGNAWGTIYNLKIELLGQFVELPLAGIAGDDYCTEILVIRAGEDPSIFNSSEAAALGSDSSIIPWGVHFDSAPNILVCLRQWLDNWCGTTWTDNVGVLRFGRLTNPANPATRPSILFDITPANAQRPIQVRSDNAQGLTTQGGARRNWATFSSSDFVTDQAIVPQDTKTRFMRKSQFQRTSSVSPAAQYSFAISAPIFDTLIDDPDALQTELDRVAAIYAYQLFSDGTIDNGKRRLVDVTVYFQDASAVGVNTVCALSAIQFGVACLFTYPTATGKDWFVAVPGIVVAWEIFPARQEILLTLLV